MKRLIYYPPGCYGTFINWICDTNNEVTADDLPFGDFGNSHRHYKKNPGLMHPKQRELFLKSQRKFGVQRGCWPINIGVKLINIDQSPDFYYQKCYNDLANIAEICDKILIMHPTVDSRVWWYQNYCEKVIISQEIVDRNMSVVDVGFRNSPWMTIRDPVLRARYQLDLQQEYLGIKDLYAEYNKQTALDFELWQLRHVLAWELHSQGAEYYQCWQHIIQKFDKIKFVSLEQLRDNFKIVIYDILNYFEINSLIVNSLDYIEKEWSLRQEHRFKDHTINKIVNAILRQESMDWQDNNLNLFDEVYIEKILHYEHGIELQPNNTWPNNTNEFLRMIK